MTRTATTIVVSIGRNREGEPMPDEDWNDFTAATLDTVAKYGDKVFVGTGTGIDPTTQGRKVSMTVVAKLTTNITGLYHELATLAYAFGQESIALTTGRKSFPGSEV